MLRPIVPVFLCLLSGVLLALPFNNGKLWIFAWFAFVPAFFALNNKSLKGAFFLFFITGIIFWWGVIYWLVHVTLAGTIALVFYLSLYFAIFGLIIRPCTKNSTPYALIFIPSVWALLEFLRGHLLTGFPWALLGYSQYLNLTVIQIADITGAFGISFLLIFVNVAIVEIICLIKNKAWPRLKITILLLIGFLSLILYYGYFRLSSNVVSGARHVRISLIQGNIPQELKWAVNAKDFILEQYSHLTKEAVKENPELVIWPEAASPALLGEDEAVFTRIFALAKEIKTPLLLGAVVREGEDYFNSALLLNAQSEIIDRYDKLHLVPFGEYIPLKKVFPFLETVVPIGDILPGREYAVMKIPNPKSQIPSKFGVLICFEDLFPGLSRNFIKRGAQFLVNITNDAWYKRTPASYQHLQASVLRAVENRVYLARAANTGISGFISPLGEILSTVRDSRGGEIFIPGYDTRDIFIEKRPLSFYTRYGDIFVTLCFLLAVYGIIFSFKHKP
ncbi:MAG: apolipoprotein N-acyltransferase [Candidatus Omnitrophica bacterium]|nr:apolipoprotein N-acyltransferase [Candidatus Omnitrophota bacterium]